MHRTLISFIAMGLVISFIKTTLCDNENH